MTEIPSTNGTQYAGSQIPIRVGYYKMERTIGKGNFALVKLATHIVMKTKVNFKFLRLKKLNDQFHDNVSFLK